MREWGKREEFNRVAGRASRNAKIRSRHTPAHPTKNYLIDSSSHRHFTRVSGVLPLLVAFGAISLGADMGHFPSWSASHTAEAWKDISGLVKPIPDIRTNPQSKMLVTRCFVLVYVIGIQKWARTMSVVVGPQLS